MKKKIIIGLIIAVIVIIVAFYLFSKNGEEQYKIEAAVLENVVKEVSESGIVKISKKINLSFKYSGRISDIYVGVGDEVLEGQNIAKIDTNQSYIELLEAESSLDMARANYEKLLAGSSSQEIEIAQADVVSAQVTLNGANQNLSDIKESVEESLRQAYEGAIVYLNDSYLKLYNAHTDVDEIQRIYFSSLDQESANVKESRDILKNGVENSKFYIDEAKEYYNREKIDKALAENKKIFSEAKDALIVIRNMAETIKYRNVVSSTDKTKIDTHKSYINTGYSNIISSEQAISTAKITSSSSINTAQSSVNSAQAGLKKAQEQLALKMSGPTQEDVNLYLAQISQAEARVSLIKNKIQESVLKSPSSGQITEINKSKGEVVQATEPIAGFLSKGPFQIEADIYEEDIVNISVGNPVKISIPAFPDETIRGSVALINPAEKIIAGVVYYEITVDLLDSKEGIRPGMTADIVIETIKKEDVLAVPRRAIRKVGSENIVKVYKDGKIEERKVEIGLEGNEKTEIVSGLSQGEQIIID